MADSSFPALPGDTSQAQDEPQDLLTSPNEDYESYEGAAASYYLPPPLTPHVTEPRDSGSDILTLVKFLQESEQRKIHQENLRRQQEEQRRREDQERFTALLQTMTLMAHPSYASPSPAVPAASQEPNSTDTTPPVVSTPSSKPVSQCPPTLQTDATFQVFRQWRRRWHDFAVMIDLSNMSKDKQLIQLRTCISLEVQKVLEHTLGIPPDTPLTVDQVLDRLQDHFKNLRNEAIRRRDLLCCRQTDGESFSDFYVRLKNLAEEVDLCSGGHITCAETQLKMVILMGVRDQELVQRLISLDTTASLQEFVTCCRSFEAARTTASAIHASPSQLRIVSTYKKDQRRRKMASSQQSTATQDTSNSSCQYCNRKHGQGKCPATDSTCTNCGRKGHWARTPKCPAKNVQCRNCNKTGHYDRCCKGTRKEKNQVDSSGSDGAPPSQKKNGTCFQVSTGSTNNSPQPLSVYLLYNGKTSRLRMLPDTGADVTVMGISHLEQLGIPRTDLQPLPATTTFTADGSPMSPALGWFQATLTLGNKSCIAKIQIHEGVQTPLLSYGHCKELAIIPPGFPKPILAVTHVNRCAELTLPTLTSPSAARDFFLWEFSDVLVSKKDLQTAPLKKMVGRPMRIYLKDNATPFAIHTPRPIPYAFQSQVKEELDSMVNQGIIEPAGDEPSEWCHPMVLVAKPNGVRITVDLSKLNSQVSRPAHPSPTPVTAVRTVTPSAKFFTTADALHGYWQIELAKEDRHLTTFITPFGRFRHCRGPMGFAATGDAFCLRGDMALQGITNCVKVVDDILLFDEDLPTHLRRINQMLTRCREYGITLNRDKFVVAAPTVNFCGYSLHADGISADPDKISAISDFPKPTNITDLRSFMGLVNQLAEFTPDIAATAQPLRPLLSPKRSFTWTPDHDTAFERVKSALLSPPVLAPFNPAYPVVLQTDASRLYSIGYALLQDHGQGQMRLVRCGSRFLTDAESRYATIELEMLAVAWAIKKCRLYLFGLPHFTLMTDHRPLIPILNSYTLDAVENSRLQKIKEKVLPYAFTAVWRAGKQLCIPDALSRAPVSSPTPEDEIECDETATHMRRIISCNVITTADESSHPHDSDRTLQELRDAAAVDPDYRRLLTCVSSGFPTNRYDLHKSVLPYWKLRDNLYSDGELVLYGQRIVVPTAFRRRTLARLHDSHRGAEATKRRARQTVFWPGIDSDIKSTIEACESCQVMQPSQQREPLLSDDHPTRPFESVSADFFKVAGKSFLVIADRLSGWPVVVPCGTDTTASRVTRMFCRYFREVGVPLRLRTDGGPPFNSADFRAFTERWGVHHVMSSPHYPQSNGHAEAAVKTVKHLILKTAPNGNIECEEFDRGLLELRNTPTPAGHSPAQVLYGRPLRSCVPAHPESFSKEWKALTENCDRRAAAHADQARQQYDSHARPLTQLTIGQYVRIQDPTSHRWDKVGIVMGCGRHRDYEVRLPSGRVWWRNCRYLRPVPLPSGDPLPLIPVVPCWYDKSSINTSPTAPRRSA